MLYIWQADVQVRHLKAPALFIDRTFIWQRGVMENVRPERCNTRDIVHDITCVVTWFLITGKGSQKQTSFCWIRPMAVKIVRHCIVTHSHWPKTMSLAQLWELDYVLAGEAMRISKPSNHQKKKCSAKELWQRRCSRTLKIDMNIRGEAHCDVQ